MKSEQSLTGKQKLRKDIFNELGDFNLHCAELSILTDILQRKVFDMSDWSLSQALANLKAWNRILKKQIKKGLQE